MRIRPGSGEFETLTRIARTTATFIQVAGSAAFRNDRLTLEDLEPTTIWLTDDPERRLGHMATGTFLDLWFHPESGLAASGMRAVLGRADPDVRLVEDAALTVNCPRISGTGLQYDAVLRTGSLPPTMGACVLFLGPGVVEQPLATRDRFPAAHRRS